MYGHASPIAAPAWDARTIPVEPDVLGKNQAKIRMKRGMFSPGYKFPEIKTQGIDDMTTAWMTYGAERNESPINAPRELTARERANPIKIVAGIF